VGRWPLWFATRPHGQVKKVLTIFEILCGRC